MINPSPIGIEIGPRRLRALRLRGRHPADAMEVDWGSGTPEDTVMALAERFGTRNRLAVAMDTALLLVKRVPLPTLSPAERRQIVALDPERFFPWREEALVVGVGGDDLVVAAKARAFDRIVEALSRLGSVDRIEPTPFALARHLGALDASDGWTVVTDAVGQDQSCAVCRLEAGRAKAIRKLPLIASDIVEAVGGTHPGPVYLYPWQPQLAETLSRAGLSPVPVPSPQGTTEAFAGAHGALLGIDSGDEPTLASAAMDRRRSLRAWRRGAMAVASLVVAAAVTTASVDYRRQRTLRDIERRVAAVEPQAREVQSLLAEVSAVEQEVSTLVTVSREREDPLEVLLLLTRLLPSDAFLRSLHGTGGDWEVDGYARDAASLIPTLEGSDRLNDVRFRSATTRVQLGDRIYESYALAFRYARPAE